MARRPSRSDVTRARKAQIEAEPPLVFTADYDHVETARTVAYKAGMPVPREAREGALAAGKAVRA